MLFQNYPGSQNTQILEHYESLDSFEKESFVLGSECVRMNLVLLFIL